MPPRRRRPLLLLSIPGLRRSRLHIRFLGLADGHGHAAVLGTGWIQAVVFHVRHASPMRSATDGTGISVAPTWVITGVDLLTGNPAR